MTERYQAHKLADRLYQGGFPPPGPALRKVGIDVLVLCAMEHQDARLYSGLTIIKAGGDDSLHVPRMMQFLPLWEQAARRAVELHQRGATVLVTCMQGWNRSGMVSAHVLRELTGAPGAQIVKHIQRRRPNALCNSTFAKYIEDTFK